MRLFFIAVISLFFSSNIVLAQNFDLGSWNTDVLFARLGTKFDFWEEGIYRVNAYYFNETNEIIIPYGTTISPFYSNKVLPGWNYGAIGCIIGHEMCHGFDDDGKDYNARGEKKKWWTRSDTMMYKRKSAALIELFNRQEVYGKFINGEKTLSENIADLGGVAIALEALKVDMEQREVLIIEERNNEFREYKVQTRKAEVFRGFGQSFAGVSSCEFSCFSISRMV